MAQILNLIIKIFGGEGGIRTLAPVTQPNPLAGDPLEPLEYFSNTITVYLIF